MRLIIEYVQGDGYTYSCTETVPVEYESAEAFAVDFEREVRSRMSKMTQEFDMGGATFYADNHSYYSEREKTRIYDAPHIFTVDEWFAYRSI